MPLHSAEALILRTYKLGEADRIVVFLTRDRGKRRGVAKGARRVRSRFQGSLEPLTLGRVSYFEDERRELVRIDEVEVVRSPLAGAAGAALGHVGYFAELLDEWTPEASPDERVFRLGASVVEAMAGGVPIDRLARYFEFWLLRLEGLYPSLVACGMCGADPGPEGAVMATREQVLVCRRCGRSASLVGGLLSADALAFLRAAAQREPGGLGSLALTLKAARELEVTHATLITAHLEKELRSARVIREIT
jgi:DNA repair protein RecO (recombination protein O)